MIMGASKGTTFHTLYSPSSLLNSFPSVLQGLLSSAHSYPPHPLKGFSKPYSSILTPRRTVTPLFPKFGACCVGQDGGINFQSLLAQYVKRTHNPSNAPNASSGIQQSCSSGESIQMAAQCGTALVEMLREIFNQGRTDGASVEKQIEAASQASISSFWCF